MTACSREAVWLIKCVCSLWHSRSIPLWIMIFQHSLSRLCVIRLQRYAWLASAPSVQIYALVNNSHPIHHQQWESVNNRGKTGTVGGCFDELKSPFCYTPMWKGDRVFTFGKCVPVKSVAWAWFQWAGWISLFLAAVVKVNLQHLSQPSTSDSKEAACFPESKHGHCVRWSQPHQVQHNICLCSIFSAT